MVESITVAEAMGDEPHVDKIEPCDPPRHSGQPFFPQVGIYFGMPEDEYHSIHACSASGLKGLSVSSMDYWARSVLNLNREDERETSTGSLTPKQLGQAYHAFIVEGPAAFSKRFAIALNKDGLKETAEKAGMPFCVTTADLRIAIDAAGAKPKGTAKEPLIDQLLDLRPAAVIWDREVAAHAEREKGKLMVSAKLFNRIVIADAMIKKDPQLKDAFSGGHAEVSIFWYDERTGAPMKARLDYIKMLHLIDLKSFSNMQGKPVQRAIDMAISNNKYFIPVVVYLEAIAAAKKMIQDTKGKGTVWVYKPFVVASEGGTKIVVMQPAPALDDLLDWCWKWAHQPEPQVLFIFQQTGIAPVTRGRVMPTSTSYIVTQGAVQFLKKKWVRCAKAYGTDPWVDFEPVVQTEDESLTWAATDFGDIE